MTDTVQWDALIRAATEARQRAYAPYSQFAVGSALLVESGEIITGCNVENATYGATCCAERTAVFTAVSRGHRSFRALAVATDAPEPAPSCGICLQVLAEFSRDLEVMFVNLNGDKRSFGIRQLLPHAFEMRGNLRRD